MYFGAFEHGAGPKLLYMGIPREEVRISEFGIPIDKNLGTNGFRLFTVGEYELVDNHQHMILPDGRKSPSTPDLLYPHTHLTGPGAAANHPINQNGLPVFNLDSDRREDLNLDVDRQQALFYSSADLLNSNVSADGTTSLDETLSNIGSADHLIHGGHGNFLSVNNSRTFIHGKTGDQILHILFRLLISLHKFCVSD